MNEPPLDLGAHVSALFATPVARYVWPDSGPLNAGLRRVVLAREQAGGGDPKNVIGGWSSGKDLLSWPEPAVAELRERLRRAAEALLAVVLVDRPPSVRLQMEAWANVSRDGHYHGIHSHPNSAWSGVYYVGVGDPAVPSDPCNGQIEFVDPRAGADSVSYYGSPFTLRARISPEPGMILMFPSWLKHMVHVFRGRGERISVAFNFNLVTSG